MLREALHMFLQRMCLMKPGILFHRMPLRPRTSDRVALGTVTGRIVTRYVWFRMLIYSSCLPEHRALTASQTCRDITAYIRMRDLIPATGRTVAKLSYSEVP